MQFKSISDGLAEETLVRCYNQQRPLCEIDDDSYFIYDGGITAGVNNAFQFHRAIFVRKVKDTYYGSHDLTKLIAYKP